MPVPSPHYLSLLLRAQATPYGIALKVLEGEVEAMKDKLSLTRRLARDPELFNLQFMIPPNRPGEIWIVKRQRGEVEPAHNVLPLRIEGG